MARPRTPLAKALATGRVLHDPKRFAGRNEPISNGPLGDPPAWMKKKEQLAAWNTFSGELPWLTKSHRSLVEIASIVRGALILGDDIDIKSLNLLRQCLGQMGATPADASRITLPEDSTESEDPSTKYF
jgi:hypothetical protein